MKQMQPDGEESRDKLDSLEDKRLEIEFARLKLDRQKASIELLLKRRELRAEKEHTGWKNLLTNPVTLAIVGGFITLMTTTITSHFSSLQSIRAEEAKAKQALQADLIKRFVDNPSPEKVRANLQFLIDVNLVPSYAESIQAYLKKTPDAQLPSAFNAAGAALHGVRTDDDAIDLVMRFEGGFFDGNGDASSATNYGITLAALERHLGKKVSIDDLRNLKAEVARDIYRKQYLIGGVSDIASVQVKAAYIGLAVNLGARRAGKFFQAAIGKIAINEDGFMGPDMLRRINAANPDTLIENANCEAVKYYKRSPYFSKFGRHWINRLRTFSPVSLTGVCQELQVTQRVDSAAQSKP